MSRSDRRAIAKVAKRPPTRYVDVTIEGGDFDGWHARARADFPASMIAGLESGSIDAVLDVLGSIIVEHNMPNSNDELAASLADVDPYAGLLAIADGLGKALQQLPNR